MEGTQEVSQQPKVDGKEAHAKNYQYRCKHCRQQLFGKGDIEHEGTVKCTSIFISQDVEWVANRSEEEWEHNLLCPKCKNKIGEIKMDGLKCHCGQWIAPGIQISLAKIDKVMLLPK